jgi:hypothetical protein
MRIIEALLTCQVIYAQDLAIDDLRQKHSKIELPTSARKTDREKQEYKALLEQKYEREEEEILQLRLSEPRSFDYDVCVLRGE